MDLRKAYQNRRGKYRGDYGCLGLHYRWEFHGIEPTLIPIPFGSSRRVQFSVLTKFNVKISFY